MLLHDRRYLLRSNHLRLENVDHARMHATQSRGGTEVKLALAFARYCKLLKAW